VAVFSAARPHHTYLFANRMKVLAHNCIRMWLAARRLNSGKLVWPRDGALTAMFSKSQFGALVLGLPWQRVGGGGVITLTDSGLCASTCQLGHAPMVRLHRRWLSAVPRDRAAIAG
jgi:hypothetical protein